MSAPRIRRRTKPKTSAQLFAERFPEGGGKGAWLYAIGFTGGITKIGSTSRLRTRINDHLNTGAVEWLHVFGRFGTSHLARAIEAHAVMLCAEIGDQLGATGRFHHLSKADVCRCVRRVAEFARGFPTDEAAEKAVTKKNHEYRAVRKSVISDAPLFAAAEADQ